MNLIRELTNVLNRDDKFDCIIWFKGSPRHGNLRSLISRTIVGLKVFCPATVIVTTITSTVDPPAIRPALLTLQLWTISTKTARINRYSLVISKVEPQPGTNFLVTIVVNQMVFQSVWINLINIDDRLRLIISSYIPSYISFTVFPLSRVISNNLAMGHLVPI